MTTPTGQQKLNFNSFKASFSSNVFALKRRFSSGDLENDQYEEQAKEVLSNVSQSPSQSNVNEVNRSTPVNPVTTTTSQQSKTISAPTSPTKSQSSIFQRLQSVTGVAREVTSNIAGSVIQNIQGGQAVVPSKIPFKEPGTLILLVIDEPNTDWSKYFSKSRRCNDYQIIVEQCEFSELSLVNFESSTICSYIQYASGHRQMRQFQPDFVLIRQNLRDAGRDYKNMLLAFMYGGLYSVNSLAAIYNFQDKPWVFAHMVGIQRKLGKNEFPLIEQNFYPDFQNMQSFVPKLPTVLKIGHAHGGLGKIRAPGLNDYQDASSVVAVTGTYCTSEQYIDSRCDVHIQKIGNQYKAFMRKGIVGHWKSGSGSAMLEQIPMTDRYRGWVDNVSMLFGGLDICALEVLIGKDGREWIIEVNDSALSLMGETQEEDRRHIADLVLSRMGVVCKVPLGVGQGQGQQTQQRYRRQSGSESVQSVEISTELPIQGITNPFNTNSSSGARRDSQGSTTSGTTATPPAPLTGTIASTASALGNKLFSRQNSQTMSSESLPPGQTAPPGTTTGPDTEDTMKNLRKTFAGIFGEM